MNKFYIDLDGIMLPDAIAAVVEAWYDYHVLTKCQQNIEAAIKDKDETIEGAILAINDLHNFKQMKIKLEKRGNKIGVRGLFPSKISGSGSTVQRISFGQPSTAAGLQTSKLLAELVIDQLHDGSFDWEKWNDKQFVASAALTVLNIYDNKAAAAI